MKKLATEFWDANNVSKDNDVRCRNDWIKQQYKEYFFDNKIHDFDEKELEIQSKTVDLVGTIDQMRILLANSKVDDKIKLLDVGSCYNPLADENSIDVTAIDLFPATTNVLKCDFLKVEISNDFQYSNERREIVNLPKRYFDAIVFSLLLEYFPCSQQRFTCCKKAYELLKSRGILIVITPDSKHVGANAQIMKSWRFVLAKLGFMRIKYEKLQHIHCMVFRKCFNKEVSVRWTRLQKFPENSPLFNNCDNNIYIPQDFHSSKNNLFNDEDDKSQQEISYSNDFIELPFSF